MTQPLKVNLGQNLKRIRLERGLSQEGLAELLGFGRSFAGALDRGEKNVSLDKLEEYAGRLNVDPLDLLRD